MNILTETAARVLNGCGCRKETDVNHNGMRHAHYLSYQFLVYTTFLLHCIASSTSQKLRRTRIAYVL